MNENKMKQSLLIGALTSSFGIFISKLLGLIYYSPLSAIAGEANMAFYSIVYTYYDLLLQISQAGIPFAMAVLVAKYVSKNDYKSVLLVKKMGISIVTGLSVAVGLILVLSANVLSRQSLGASAPLKDINDLRVMFYILTVAVIVVPFLSALRGYIQGLKRLDIYASSQVLEQFVRVFSIILFAILFVSLLGFDQIWAIFAAVGAASLGAIAAYIFTKTMARRDETSVRKLAQKQQDDCPNDEKDIVKEILALGLPFVVISFLGTAGPLVNTTFFMDYMTKVNGPGIYESAKLSAGILQANIAKISNIPSVLALGFGSGMVPYLSESLEKGDKSRISKQIVQILDTVMFVLMPMIFVFICFPKDIYFIMYGNSNLDLCARLFLVSNIQIFLGTLAPIFSSIMMSLKMRKQAIVTLIVSFLIKLLSFFPLVRFFGAYGMIYSSGLYYLTQIVMYYLALHARFSLSIRNSLRRLAAICICCLAMALPVVLIHRLIGFAYLSRTKDILLMGCLGVVMLGIYYAASVYLHLPQRIFEIEDVSPRSLLKKFRS